MDSALFPASKRYVLQARLFQAPFFSANTSFLNTMNMNESTGSSRTVIMGSNAISFMTTSAMEMFSSSGGIPRQSNKVSSLVVWTNSSASSILSSVSVTGSSDPNDEFITIRTEITATRSSRVAALPGAQPSSTLVRNVSSASSEQGSSIQSLNSTTMAEPTLLSAPE